MARRTEVAALFVFHRVRDYEAWRRVYDSVAGLQKAGGVTDEAVYRAEGDPNHVLVFHRFGSLAQAHAFVESSELRAAMGEAGVEESTLCFEFFEEA